MLRGIFLSIVGAFLFNADMRLETPSRVASVSLTARVFVDQIVNHGTVRCVKTPKSPIAEAMLTKPSFGIGVSKVYAQTPDFNIKTPTIQAIQQKMENRFDSQLRIHFDTGVLGFSEDGLVVVRDASAITEKDRVAVHTAVADENRDRKAVYHEIAVANGHPEWEGQIRQVFAKQWVDSAKGGWWYQRDAVWHQK